MTSATDNRTTEKPVSGMRVWDVVYVKSDCPHCGWDDNRTNTDELSQDELWEWFPFDQRCEVCGKAYRVMVDDDDR